MGGTVNDSMTHQVSPDGKRAGFDWLIGGGEMGARIRAHNWSATPLGSPETWPQSLRSAVSILLPSKAQIVLFWGPELIAIYNDAYAPVFGAKHPWALGRPARETWSEIWEDVLGPLFEGVIRTGEAFWAKEHPFFLHRDGFLEETYFDVSYDPVRIEDGTVGGLFCIVSDQTGRVLGERRLRTLRELGTRTADAKSAEEVCRTAAAALAGDPADVPFSLLYLIGGPGLGADLVGIGGVEPDHLASERRIVIADNHALASARDGRAAEVAAGVFLSRVPETAADQAMVLPISSGTQVVGTLVAGVSRYLRLAGDYRDFFDLAAARISAAVANASAYEEERKRAEALAELDRAKTAFFSNISHEFRTPLTLMLGPLEDVLRNPPEDLPPADREQLAVAHRNSVRLVKLVNTLLDFSRIEAGRNQASYEPVDLPAYTAELASVFQSAVEKAGLKLVVDCPPLPEPVHVDPEMWEKIVLNLLSNALKFTLEGEIGVSVRPAGTMAELSIRDTGTGIPAEDIPHVFERFYRARSSRGRTFEGSGIGLALVQELVKLHGGAVRVTSEVDRGTVFTVSIPLGTAHLPADRIGTQRSLASTSARGEAYVQEALGWLPEGEMSKGAMDASMTPADVAPSITHEGSARFSPAARPPEAAPRPARVLVADDHADMREYLRRLLSSKYEVIAVNDGEAAWRAAREDSCDLVLMDVMMPRLDGFEVLRRLRAEERTREIPVILLSARAGEESRIEGMDAGADDYMIKPFSARELLARVESHLRLQSVRRAAQEALRTSEAKFSAAFDQSPLAFTITPLDGGGFVDVNEGFVLLSGYTREEALGRTPEDLHLWVEPEHHAEGLAVLRAGGRISNTEVRFRRKGGEELICLIGSSVINIRSQPHVLSSVIDVTRRRQAEEAVRESERRFREMIDALPAAVYTTDATGRLTHFNRAAVEFSGRVPELGTDHWCVTWKLYYPHGTPMPHDECPMAIALKEGRPVRGAEAIAERPDGTRIWFEPFPTPVLDSEGRVVGGINMLLDISARKKASEAQSRLAAIVAYSEDAIISKDLDGVMTSWNRGAERLFGYTADETIGRPVTMLFPPDRLDEEPRILAQIRRGEPIEHYDTVRRRKDGTLVDISLTVSPVRDERGQIVGISKVARDITVRRRAEDALRQAEESRRQSLELALQTEREIAETLQRSLLSSPLPEVEGISLAARYIPASPEAKVGGDFYDVFTLPSGHLGLAIGDVAGYGVQAASVMGQVRILLRAYAHEGHPPATVIDRLNRLLGPGEMVTLLYLVLDLNTGYMSYANAGHPPPLVASADGTTRFLYGVDPPLVGGSYQYNTFGATVVPTSTVILYTDGLVESDESIDLGLTRLAEVSRNLVSAELEDIATMTVHSLVGETQRRDDVALLIARLQPIDPERFRITLPSVPHSLPTLRSSLRRWLEASGVSKQEVFDIVVACGEAGTNVVEHAYGPDGGSFEVEARRDDDRVLIWIRDKGIWRPRSEGGRGHGLSIIHDMMDSVEVVRGPGGTTVQLQRRLRLTAEV